MAKEDSPVDATDASQQLQSRCGWVTRHADLIHYHDSIWGVPTYSDHTVFEFLLLETFQAGLSWMTILRKRPAFADVFHNFDVDAVASMTESDVQLALQDARIIRHPGKIRAAITNARAVIRMRESGFGIADYFWRWVKFVPCSFRHGDSLVARNDLSDRIAKDMKKRGFRFVGSVVIFSHLQSTGVINDHAPSCPRFEQVRAMVRPPPVHLPPDPCFSPPASADDRTATSSSAVRRKGGKKDDERERERDRGPADQPVRRSKRLRKM